MTRLVLSAAEGPPLYLRTWPAGAATRTRRRRAAFLGHSQPTHAGMLDELAEAFSAGGYDVFAGDIRGHGRSVSNANPAGHLPLDDGWACAVADMRALLATSFEGVAWEDRLIVAPNISALLVLEALKDEPGLARNIVLISPPPNQNSIARFGRAFARVRMTTFGAQRPDELALHHLYAFLGAHLKDRRTPADVMSADPAIVDRVLADPLAWPTPTPAYWYWIFTGILSAWDWPRSGRVREGTRCLLMFGGEDAMLRDGGFIPPVADLLARIGVEAVDTMKVEGARSALFLEEKRLRIAERICAWAAGIEHNAEDLAETSIAEVTEALMERLGGSSKPLEPDALIELCYGAVDDESRWVEMLYRIIAQSDEPEGAARAERWLAELMPHWERSYRLRRQVMLSATMGVLLESVTDRLGIGVGILDRERNLVHANERFRGIAGRLCAALEAGDRTPTAPDVAEQTRRLLSVGLQSLTVADASDGAVMIGGEPVGFHFHPPALARTSARVGGPASILVLRVPERVGAPDGVDLDTKRALLKLCYALTDREAEIAILVTKGLRPEDIAARLEISVGTARTHLKRIFGKTEASGQHELATLLLQGPIGWL
jgi:alpha-beta hydrolase superfamily lysophospholipase/DNA-binding CsgD family transcriptional regulator